MNENETITVDESTLHRITCAAPCDVVCLEPIGGEHGAVAVAAGHGELAGRWLIVTDDRGRTVTVQLTAHGAARLVADLQRLDWCDNADDEVDVSAAVVDFGPPARMVFVEAAQSHLG